MSMSKPEESAPEHANFVAAEGQYILREDIIYEQLQPCFTYGTQISLVSVRFKESSNKVSFAGSGSFENGFLEKNELFSGPSRSEEPDESESGLTRRDSIVSDTSQSPFGKAGTTPEEAGFSSLFGTVKRKKTKNNITKTTSSFVARIITNDNIAKILASRTSEDTYLFFNIGKTFLWCDLFGRPKEPLSRINFTKAIPTCHDVNLLTRSSSHLDIVIGFSSGDIMWFDPLSNKYIRINKQGVINSSPVTSIKWMPGSENLFMASHQDGSLIVYDKEKDDQTFSTNVGTDDDPLAITKARNNKHNPNWHWQVSKKAVTAFAFSPDCQHIAAVCMDGCLRIIDFFNERLQDTYHSYFGGFTCVCWSPDGKYVLTGGQDDLVTIWAFREQRIVARCQGHQSWVTGVAFDPWRCDEKNYRFGSVGEDTRLLLWDFSVNALHRPKGYSSNRRGSVPFILPAPSRRRFNDPQVEDRKGAVHPALSKSDVAILQPVMTKSVHGEPLNSVAFREDAVITTCRRGHIKVWLRP
ncbi:WD40 repeat-like protein [Basidiobolus meristosporus CBS 931.73]|uniref:WD40 repeat-like protein n=1 Tax=Basidiobolus meristosporus CBS 931.73 TaxID=1314790 RepID=A0A1Y1Y3V0_9FUNG|nr:WD40 repeat-like protein [Basidiobolus meristosporus CBS 931.73]|eukprot:ORX92690.1 WD40 repeat-like protein [Basidiobolus meristosporus CBS 931.73]